MELNTHAKGLCTKLILPFGNVFVAAAADLNFFLSRSEK